MKLTSHLLDEAISLSGALGTKDDSITCSHIIYGFIKLITLEPAYANAMFTSDELALLARVKQVLDYDDYDYQLIKVGMPLIAGGNEDSGESAKLLDELLESCSDEETLVAEIIKAKRKDFRVFTTGHSIADVLDRARPKTKETESAGDGTEAKATASDTPADGSPQGVVIDVCLDEGEAKKDPSPEKKADGKTEEKTEDKKEEKEEEDLFTRIADKTDRLYKALLSEVIGQDEAVLKFVRGYFNSNYAATGEGGGPRAAFFLTGPAGSGKSFTAAIAARTLGMPCHVLDMKEFSIPSNITDFIGVDKNYGGSRGRLHNFVRENPSGLIILENIEECYLSILNAVAQILQSGRLYSPADGDYTDFHQATIIMTSRLGSAVYDDPAAGNLSAVPDNVTIDCIRGELGELWHGDFAVDAFCRGLESKDIILFGNLRTRHLLTCIDRAVEKLSAATEARYGYKCIFDPKISALLLHGTPSVSDARTALAECQRFLKNEFFEIAGLRSAYSGMKDISTILFEISKDDISEEIAPLFTSEDKSDVLVICKEGDRGVFTDSDRISYRFASNIEEAKEAALNGALLAVIDPYFGTENDNENLALEDSYTDGLDMIWQFEELRIGVPVYIFDKDGKLNDIDRNYLLRLGAVGIIDASEPARMSSLMDLAAADEQTDRKCRTLIRRNGYISYKSAQRIDEKDSSLLHVMFYDLKMRTAIGSSGEMALIRDTERPDTVFDDVIGAENAKSELQYFIKYLRDPRGFILSGGKPPKGVLLYGPPGTGKTMLARAMAGESKVAFIQTSATQFMDKYVGESERKIRDIFKRAKQYAPAIIFIDEIDAIGKERTGSSSTQYTESMLNALLTEMDGFRVDPDNPVFVLAATNYGMSRDPNDPRKLDEALLRRFDNKILVDLPNREERIRYIKLKLEKIQDNAVTEDAVNNIADRTTGQSLAILQNIIDLAFRNAVKAEAKLDNITLMEALEEFNYGERHEWQQKYYESTAVHEAGHAVMAYLSGETPAFATIVSRGNFGGYVQPNTGEDKPTYSRGEMLWNVRVALAGRAAEIVFFGEEAAVNTGASSDLQSATRYALHMICSYGMMSGRMIALPVETILRTPLADKYIAEANELIQKEMKEAESIIAANKDKVEIIANALMKENYLTSTQIEALLGKED